ncbi:hypothetical protein [Euzebya sp.]|uniref:hypothetical protein n=1 Tax=Euzebya sp. TaxID=1971409 RepID=UPI003513793E
MPSTIRRIIAGAAAGVIGTAAMDAVWYRRYRQGGGDAGPVEWDLSTGSTGSFDEASTPGQVGEAVAEAIGVDLPDDAAGVTTDVVHWLTGISYGVGHALLHDERGVVTGGLATGMTAFLNSYLTLGAAGFYQPIWDYEAEELAKDLGAHLAYGLAAAAAYRVLRRRG